MKIFANVVIMCAVLWVCASLMRRKKGYKIEKIKIRAKTCLSISGFDPALSGTDFVLIHALMEDLTERDSTIIVVANLDEFKLEDDAVAFSARDIVEENVLYAVRDWRIYSGRLGDAALLIQVSKLWRLQRGGNDGGVTFFGCRRDDASGVMKSMADAISSKDESFMTSDDLIIKVVSTIHVPMLFNIGADGDTLYIDPCGAKPLIAIEEISRECVRKAGL